MFLLPSIALGLVVALVLGGRLSRLLEVQLRRPWAPPAALALQILAFSAGGAAVPAAASRLIHLLSYALLAVFALANRRVRALLVVFAGMALNALAIAANGGRMPISPGAAHVAGIPLDQPSNLSAGASHLRFLGDIFALPSQVPLVNVFSIGDILIGIGMIAFIAYVSVADGRAPFSAALLAAPLRVKPYRRLLAARLLSQTGDWLTMAAVVGWMFEQTHSTANVAGVLLVRLAPPILGSGLAALIVDRLPKRPLLVGVEAARGGMILVALAGVVAGAEAQIFAALALSSFLGSLSAAAIPALVPRLVPEEAYGSANAGLGIAADGATAIGALGGGAALALIGIGPTLVLDLATFGAAGVLLLGLPAGVGEAERIARSQPRLHGLRYLLAHRRLLVLVFAFATATLATGLTNTSLPRLLEGHAGLGSASYGFGFGAIAAGLAVGQVAVGLTRLGDGASRWIGAGLLLMSGLLALVALDTHPATLLLLLAAVGVIDGTTDVVFETVVQREADPHVLGSIFGFAAAFVRTTMMLSVALAPLANRFLPVGTVVLGAAAVLALASLVAIVGLGSRPLSMARPREARAVAGG
ncbi:MAG: MFS transporter [Gaiellaceae bacterium]